MRSWIIVTHFKTRFMVFNETRFTKKLFIGVNEMCSELGTKERKVEA